MNSVAAESFPNITIFCLIRTFNRETSESLSDSVEYKLDWALATREETEEILRWLSDDDASKGPVPTKIGETIISKGMFSPKTFPVQSFRHLFVEVNEQSEVEELNRTSLPSHQIVHLPSPFDYIEDECGKPVSERDATIHLMQRKVGPNYVLWDLQTMLKAGPRPMLNASAWSVEEANTLNQFLRVVEQIHRSSWIQHPINLTFRKSESCTKLIEVHLPDEELTLPVCTFFRQLFSRYRHDLLMARACKAYARHSSEQIRVMWIESQFQQFDKLLGDPPPFSKATESLRDFLDAFLYGCKVMHAKSAKGAETQIVQLCQKYGQENVATEIQMGFRHLAGIAAQIYHVIKLDFDFWMSSGSYIKPNFLSPTDFLKSWRLDALVR